MVNIENLPSAIGWHLASGFNPTNLKSLDLSFQPFIYYKWYRSICQFKLLILTRKFFEKLRGFKRIEQID